MCNIEKCICNKLKKLNDKDYKKFSKNYLFMTDQNIILEQECPDLFNKYKLLQEGYKYQY